MAKYLIVQPCAYAVGGKGVHHTEPGAIVDLDAATARVLGDMVQRIEPARKSEPRRSDGDDK